jgi:hypothetical protein
MFFLRYLVWSAWDYFQCGQDAQRACVHYEIFAPLRRREFVLGVA